MEMHLVHISNQLDKENKSATADGDVPEGLAVLGFLFEVGCILGTLALPLPQMSKAQVSKKDNAMLLPITHLLKKIPNWKEETEFEEEFPDVRSFKIFLSPSPIRNHVKSLKSYHQPKYLLCFALTHFFPQIDALVKDAMNGNQCE